MPRRSRSARIRSMLMPAILVAMTASPSRIAAQSPTLSSTEPARTFADPVAEAARRFGLPERWLWAVMRAESGGARRALSPAGAMGLMQIMPATWATLSARYALGPDAYDVRANIHAGAAYLREMLDRYGDLGTALAAYNAGPGRVDDWRSGARSLPSATPVYVARIAAAVGISRASAPMASPATLLSWRNATLFIVRSDGPSGRIVAAGILPTGDRHEASSAPDLAQQPRANSLFVAQTGRGKP